MLYGESLTLFNFVAGGVYSPFIQLIRGDFLGEVAWTSCSKESFEESWVREHGFRCLFSSPGWQVGAFFSESHTRLLPIGTGEVPG